MSEWSPAPDFELAPLLDFDPRVFNWDEPNKELKNLYAFIISLALIYNDLKDLAWWSKQLDKYPPKDLKPSAYLGQHAGMKNHISRLILGLYCELLKSIVENKNILECSEFQNVLKSVPKEFAENWDMVVSQSSEKETLDLLENLRSNGIYHYSQISSIMAGYKEYFGIPSDELNKRAFFSSGKNVLDSRFYFADAAAQGYARKFNDKPIDYYLREVTTSLKTIVDAAIFRFTKKKDWKHEKP